MSDLSLKGSGGGGKGGGGDARTPVEYPNTLRATNIAHIVDLIGEGPIEGLVDGLRSVYFDNTPIENSDGSFNYEGVSVSFRPGTPEQARIAGLPGVETEVAVDAEVRKDAPIVRSFNNPEADAVRVRIQIPALTKQNKENGDLKGASVSFRIEVKPSDQAQWQNPLNATISGKTTSPYQKSYRVPLKGDSDSWDVRVVRITADSESSTLKNSLVWATYTQLIDAKLSYPDSALIGVQADSRQFGSSIPQRAYHVRGLIVSVPSNYDPVTREYSGIWNGTFKKAWTDNPAWIYYDVLRSVRYGAGQKFIDKWALYQISRYCDELVDDGYGGLEPRFTCNVVINTREDAFKVLGSLSSVFRGMTYWSSDQVMPVADMPSDPVMMFSRANIVGDFEYSGTAKKTRHSAVLVSWNDPEDFFRQTIEMVDDPELVQKFGWNQKDVTAFGCSSRGQARRIGKWILYTEKYETETVSFTAGSDAYLLRPGSIIEIADPYVTGARLSGRVLVTDTVELQLDAVPEELELGWELDVVLPSGGVETRKVVDYSGNLVTLENPLSQEPINGAMWMLRSSEAYPQTFRVLAVAEGDEALTFDINALKHYPDKYALVEDGEPLPDRPISLIPQGPVTAPYNITVETYTYISGGRENQGIMVSWTESDDPRVQSYLVEGRGPSDTQWKQYHSGAGVSFDIGNAEAGVWSFRVRGVSGIGSMSAWTYRETQVQGLLEPMAATTIDVKAGTFNITLRPKGGTIGALWEFWRSNVALETSMITSNAVLLATSTDLVDADLEPATTYYYYVRGVNAYGVSDWYPVQATTRNDPEQIMSVISGQIKKTDLFQELSENIDGLNDSWVVKVDGNGNVGGIGLAYDETQDVIDFGIRADRLYIVDPADPLSADFPFIFDSGTLYLREALIQSLTVTKLRSTDGTLAFSNGRLRAEYIDADNLNLQWGNIQNVSIGNADIQNGAITAAKIGTAQITRAKIGTAAVDTLRIAGNAVTVPVSTYAYGTYFINLGATTTDRNKIGNWYTISELNINPQGGDLYVLVSFSYLLSTATAYSSSGSDSYGSFDTRMLIDNGVAVDWGRTARVGFGTEQTQFSANFTRNNVAGTTNIKVQVRVGDYMNRVDLKFYRRSLGAIGTRR